MPTHLGGERRPAAGLALCACAPAPASAGTITVTTTLDRLDASAPCSLREAVNVANADADGGGCTDPNPAAADVIRLAAGDYNLRLPGAEDANASGDLDVTETVTITGAGPDVSGIDANGALTGDRALHVAAGTLTLTGLTIHDGSAVDGGGILGGPDTTVRLTDSTVTGNAAADEGGGIYANIVTLTDSTVSGNSVNAPAGQGEGGGIYTSGGRLTRSTLNGNDAGGAAPAAGSAS